MHTGLLRTIAGVMCITLVMVTAPGYSSAQKRAGNAPTIDQVIEPLFSVQRFDGVAISPDGSRVAWVQAIRKKDGSPSEKTAIFIANAKNPSTARVRITAGAAGSSYSEHDISWSPDGRSVAFLSDARIPGQHQLYVAPAAGGPARKLTSLKGFLAYPSWSPDGKLIAVLFTENAPRAGGPLQPMTPESGVIESHIYEQRLATVDARTGEV